jgi:putative glycerol-1-phosphate prenyltransferase
MGMKLVYLDAGSGALQPVNNEIIKAVKHLTNLPVIVGGGVNSAEKAKVAFQAGADIVVIGNALEDDRAEALLQDISFILSLKD